MLPFTSMLTYFVRNIVFYRTESGGSRLKTLSIPDRVNRLKKSHGSYDSSKRIDSVPAQYFKKLPGTEDIWEVRVQSGSDTLRLLGQHCRELLVE